MIEEKSLDALRESLALQMSEKRYRHTCEVEKMAIRLGELYCPDKIPYLRAAALLHDITKEYSVEEHLAVCEKYGIGVSGDDLLAPKTFHARTAAALIPDVYPQFCEDEIVSAVRYHTTGREGMTLFESLIYLADYIDESRKFEDCVTLRNMFWDAKPEKMNGDGRMKHLRSVLLESFNMTISGLMHDGGVISEDTFLARNDLVRKNINNK